MPKANKSWKPDDSFHDIIDGEFKGVLRVKKACKDLGVTFGKKIVTSRDRSMPALLEKLRRTTLPPGFEQWQLPIILGGGNRPVMFFVTVGSPNAKLPHHRHRNDSLFRIVLSGSITYNGIELTSGDWMYVPTGQPYSFKAGKSGCVIMHTYNGSN
jgi:quercetin dioxygenase-like cupin family protein